MVLHQGKRRGKHDPTRANWLAITAPRRSLFAVAATTNVSGSSLARRTNVRGVCMDRRPERKAKRAREEDADAAPDFPFEEAAAAALGADDDAGEASRRPPGVFRFPWQKCRGGLGVSPGAGAGGAGWELRDVFFRSLVDGGAAAIGVPGDRLVSPPRSKRALLDGVDAWLAAAADGEVDPVWRSALMSRRGPASSAA
ncbi:hypothetical protein SETIT_2G247300v2 [Setaria italica]|uniref:Uncharacterized protein n=2 Tax=Setaria italica TaxID=4555 RepID=A0A368Q4J5_SETIT|nr:hypothetical protein SETIT_2G247300v2 [Setaria italica]